MSNIIEISSESNSNYKKFLDVRKNGKKYGLVLVEGEDLVKACIDSHSLVNVISYKLMPEYMEYRQAVLSKKLYKNLSSYQSLPKVMGIAKYSLSEEMTDRVIYLDGIQDPGNLGTIERSALAFGFKSVVLSKDCVSPFNYKAVQASKGSMFDLNIKYENLEDMVKMGYQLYLTCLDGQDVRYTKLEKKGKVCLVIGNEGQGIRKEHLNLPGHKIRLEISQKIESLNAGVAASIFMYLWS
ncbi:MAG: RNA methyltransferase [Bacilli bacterium]